MAQTDKLTIKQKDSENNKAFLTKKGEMCLMGQWANIVHHGPKLSKMVQNGPKYS